MGEPKASYWRAKASGAGTDCNDAHQVAVGHVHNLFKSTALCGAYSAAVSRPDTKSPTAMALMKERVP